ncbi:hypothetical protein BEWA_048040 [Theileria equi strain WA]|uniref:Signal peptide-containing protein n=1 Tax=Theileria equi strain WA TaxID=1537102 RepID=L1LA68_THEEQ|nr:hypothetical protein BEWA_048040 [Theileria equi strain WA]EKX72337.1 hypothetical protein BEWA_048040 [Theileria equi strain WA]|eukprot:XP_004831789.1 hypothetical protein BEWA_048040 [Theileria equi strain WA]
MKIIALLLLAFVYKGGFSINTPVELASVSHATYLELSPLERLNLVGFTLDVSNNYGDERFKVYNFVLDGIQTRLVIPQNENYIGKITDGNDVIWEPEGKEKGLQANIYLGNDVPAILDLTTSARGGFGRALFVKDGNVWLPKTEETERMYNVVSWNLRKIARSPLAFNIDLSIDRDTERCAVVNFDIKGVVTRMHIPKYGFRAHGVYYGKEEVWRCSSSKDYVGWIPSKFRATFAKVHFKNGKPHLAHVIVRRLDDTAVSYYYVWQRMEWKENEELFVTELDELIRESKKALSLKSLHNYIARMDFDTFLEPVDQDEYAPYSQYTHLVDNQTFNLFEFERDGAIILHCVPKEGVRVNTFFHGNNRVWKGKEGEYCLSATIYHDSENAVTVMIKYAYDETVSNCFCNLKDKGWTCVNKEEHQAAISSIKVSDKAVKSKLKGQMSRANKSRYYPKRSDNLSIHDLTVPITLDIAKPDKIHMDIKTTNSDGLKTTYYYQLGKLYFNEVKDNSTSIWKAGDGETCPLVYKTTRNDKQFLTILVKKADESNILSYENVGNLKAREWKFVEQQDDDDEREVVEPKQELLVFKTADLNIADVDQSLFDTFEDYEDKVHLKKFTAKTEEQIGRIVDKDAQIWKSELPGERCTLATVYYDGKEPKLVYLVASGFLGSAGINFYKRGSKWIRVSKEDYNRVLSRMKDIPYMPEQHHADLDINYIDSKLFAVDEAVEDGILVKEFTVRHGYILTDIFQSSVPIWEGGKGESCTSALVYYDGFTAIAATIHFVNGYGNKFVKYLVHEGKKWVHVDKEEHQKLLIGLRERLVGVDRVFPFHSLRFKAYSESDLSSLGKRRKKKVDLV